MKALDFCFLSVYISTRKLRVLSIQKQYPIPSAWCRIQIKRGFALWLRNSDNEFTYHNAICFKINIPNIGPAQAIYYDVAALKKSCEYIKKNKKRRDKYQSS